MKGVYIHIPFCKSICSYCDFCKVFYDRTWSLRYLKKLEEEIDNFYMGEEVCSLYIGGGTPSCLQLEDIETLLSLTKKFKITKEIEFTFECNLQDITVPMLKILKKYHVNRLSIGIQSFDNKKLDFLGRTHSFFEAKEKIELCRSLGFTNINLDLIYGVYHETIKELKQDLKQFLLLQPDHISTYSLMLNDHTLLKVNRIPSISEDIDAAMYEKICKILKNHGYSHYEVSNFAKPGKESFHNLLYWNNEEYYGFGVSASGYLDQIRYTNTKNLFAYLKGETRKEEILLSKQDIMDYEIMVGLRKTKGINTKIFQEKYHIAIEDAYPIKPLLKNKELKQKKEYIFIPQDKLYVMNEILLKMI